MGRRKHIDQLKEFRKKLSKNIKLDKMFLFGSRAKGKPTRYSDFDLLIVSPSFKKKKSLERGLGFYKLWNLDYPVDFLCYTPEEFNKYKKKLTIVREAVEKGIEIKSK
ncbi:MAG: nucleotidyltransferase domain-containing protein [Nanoarchaeota archaeon]|nr:nucleotidyltransferase domain-containing protein [Nanoarchaeota archaeon]MBU1644677.1 nucleotidyltransferase domain-containing protein [Nanoarchaeota archaeon]MBU1976572.1 nucleotidyltransferase domain-containing protein [Nanoarchaeota archaeon]